MITLNQMHHFISVARNHSITKAAEELYIVQPAISTSLKKIETEIRTNLFYYKSKKMYLTDAGEKVYDIFNEILAAYQKLDEIANTNATLPNSNYNYFATPFVHDKITPKLPIFHFSANYSCCTYDCNNIADFFTLSQDDTNAFGLFLLSDDDLTDSMALHPEYSFLTVFRAQFELMTSYKNSSSIVKEVEVTMEQIKDLPYISLINPNVSWKNYYEKYCAKTYSTTSNPSLIALALTQNSNTFVLASNKFLPTNEKMELLSIPIIDAPYANLVLVYSTSQNEKPFFKQLINTLQHLYKS